MDNQLIQNEVILGVDTHLDRHVGAVIDCRGKLLGVLSTETNITGNRKLLIWAQSFGNCHHAGKAGTA